VVATPATDLRGLGGVQVGSHLSQPRPPVGVPALGTPWPVPS